MVWKGFFVFYYNACKRRSRKCRHWGKLARNYFQLGAITETKTLDVARVMSWCDMRGLMAIINRLKWVITPELIKVTSDSKAFPFITFPSDAQSSWSHTVAAARIDGGIKATLGVQPQINALILLHLPGREEKNLFSETSGPRALLNNFCQHRWLLPEITFSFFFLFASY